MSRRDTIIVAVLINAGLLTLLFATAMNSDDDQNFVRRKASEAFPESQLISGTPPAPSQQTVVDEVDQAIATYRSREETPVTAPSRETTPSPIVPNPNEVIVRVKEGDNLEKIARSNGTTVQAIILANKLKTFSVQVGQSLRVPLKPASVALPEADKEVFYIVKNGDNPWVISRRTGVKFEEILRLNGLDERKARRLQPGDKLRIR